MLSIRIGFHQITAHRAECKIWMGGLQGKGDVVHVGDFFEA
jgi:hypothetical protein